MAGKSRSYQKNLEFIAKDIGKDLIPYLSKETILEHMTPEELVRGLAPEDLVRILTPEERKKLKQLLEEEYERNQR